MGLSKEETSLDRDLDEIEKARQNFESLVTPHLQNEKKDEDSVYVPPPLTTSSRKRRLLEMDLLASLEDSNDAVDELMHLWLCERDAVSTQQLVAMQEACSPGLVQEEQQLRAMVDQYGVDWPEPAARLATLLYYKGRSEESMEWASRVLRVKPWHFEVIHLQVINSLRMKDRKKVWQYARRTLPPLNPHTNNARRKKWVKQALQDAQESYAKAEKSFQQLSVSEPELPDNLWQ